MSLLKLGHCTCGNCGGKGVITCRFCGGKGTRTVHKLIDQVLNQMRLAKYVTAAVSGLAPITVVKLE